MYVRHAGGAKNRSNLCEDTESEIGHVFGPRGVSSWGKEKGGGGNQGVVETGPKLRYGTVKKFEVVVSSSEWGLRLFKFQKIRGGGGGGRCAKGGGMGLRGK